MGQGVIVYLQATLQPRNFPMVSRTLRHDFRRSKRQGNVPQYTFGLQSSWKSFSNVNGAHPSTSKSQYEPFSIKPTDFNTTEWESRSCISEEESELTDVSLVYKPSASPLKLRFRVPRTEEADLACLSSIDPDAIPLSHHFQEQKENIHYNARRRVQPIAEIPETAAPKSILSRGQRKHRKMRVRFELPN